MSQSGTAETQQPAPDPAAEKEQFDEVVRAFELSFPVVNESPDFDLLIDLIDRLERACNKGGLQEHKIAQHLIENRYTRVASVISRVATHESARITHEQMERLCRRKQTVAYIFNASGYRNMKHLIALSGTDEGGRYRITLQRAAVLLCFLAMEDISDELMETVLRQPPRVLLTLMLGWLNQRAILTPQAEKNRSRLLNSGELIKDVVITDRDIPLIVNAWMYCTYATDPKKHDIKFYFNGLLKRRMDEAAITLEPPVRRIVSRPRMLVIHERFIHKHAMYRCYAPYIDSLREHFELVALVDEEMIDDIAARHFDDVVKLEKPRPTVKQIAEIAAELKPDVVYYPSLGMSHWTVMLANLRLAPVQLATMGHPATTRSSELDYVFSKHMENDPTEIYSEYVLMGRRTSLFAPHAELATDLPALPKASERLVKIAINSKVMKLSYRLIEICKRLETNSSIPLEFSFFPGERHLFYDGLSAAIKAQLPSAKVYPYMGYSAFINEIARCDLALAAFPFGNTNSTVDTCLLGLPTVVHHGPEVPAQTDELVLESAGYESWIICKDDEEYYQAALRFINEPELRHAVTRGQTRTQIRDRLFNADQFMVDEPFARMVWHAYRHHEELQRSKVRVLSYQDLPDLDHD